MSLTMSSQDWTVKVQSDTGEARRSGPTEPEFPAEFLTADSSVVETFSAKLRGKERRQSVSNTLDLSYDLSANELAILAIRHPPGAASFDLPQQTNQRTVAKKATTECRFVVLISIGLEEAGRQGLIGKLVGYIIRAVVERVDERVLPNAVFAFEKALWKKKGLTEGFYRLDRKALHCGELVKAIPKAAKPTLLFIHATFSNAQVDFRGLADSDFFRPDKERYKGRIFAYKH